MSLGCVTSKMNAVTPTLSIFANASTPSAPSQEPCASIHKSQKLEREEQQHRHDEDHERGSGRQAIDQGDAAP